jgi:preprotein translocase subunit Sec63
MHFLLLTFSRTAQKNEIIRAYRKLAAQWHPDQYDGDDKKHAEKMFIDIAAAKEVLTDPGMSVSHLTSYCFSYVAFRDWISNLDNLFGI